jgi:hypothetical protein
MPVLTGIGDACLATRVVSIGVDLLIDPTGIGTEELGDIDLIRTGSRPIAETGVVGT